MVLAAPAVMTRITGALLAGIVDPGSPAVWLAAALLLGVVTIFVRRLTAGYRRPGDGRTDADPGGYRCPLCAGAGTEPQRYADRDAPPGPICRQCGGRGYVDRL